MVQAADFFVSYTGADRAWAEWIAWQLEAEGYEVVVQAWDFTPGKSWAHEMQRATATAKRVVVVLSAAYLESEPNGRSSWPRIPLASVACCCPFGLVRSTCPGRSRPGSTSTWLARTPPARGRRC
jgi:hypothetical protein